MTKEILNNMSEWISESLHCNSLDTYSPKNNYEAQNHEILQNVGSVRIRKPWRLETSDRRATHHMQVTVVFVYV